MKFWEISPKQQNAWTNFRLSTETTLKVCFSGYQSLKKKRVGGNMCNYAHCICDLESHNEYQHFKSACALWPKSFHLLLCFYLFFKILFILNLFLVVLRNIRENTTLKIPSATFKSSAALIEYSNFNGAMKQRWLIFLAFYLENTVSGFYKDLGISQQCVLF